MSEMSSPADVVRLDGTAPDPVRDGFYVLPRGKLVNHCIYLEMLRPQVPLAEPPLLEGLHLDRLTGSDRQRYLDLFRRIAVRWLWGGHLAKSEAEIAVLLDAANVETWLVRGRGGDLGVLQLEHDAGLGTELLYFGLVEEAIGQGVGRWLIETAKAKAFRHSSRFWLHTCNFDHPRALAFYQAAGLRVYATGFEVMDDPRLTGRLPPTAGPHVALVP